MATTTTHSFSNPIREKVSEARVAAAAAGRGRVGHQNKQMEGWDGAREICRLGFLPSLFPLSPPPASICTQFPAEIEQKKFGAGPGARDALKNGLDG